MDTHGEMATVPTGDIFQHLPWPILPQTNLIPDSRAQVPPLLHTPQAAPLRSHHGHGPLSGSLYHSDFVILMDIDKEGDMNTAP